MKVQRTVCESILSFVVIRWAVCMLANVVRRSVGRDKG